MTLTDKANLNRLLADLLVTDDPHILEQPATALSEPRASARAATPTQSHSLPETPYGVRRQPNQDMAARDCVELGHATPTDKRNLRTGNVVGRCNLSLRPRGAHARTGAGAASRLAD